MFPGGPVSWWASRGLLVVAVVVVPVVVILVVVEGFRFQGFNKRPQKSSTVCKVHLHVLGRYLKFWIVALGVGLGKLEITEASRSLVTPNPNPASPVRTPGVQAMQG